MPARLDPRNRTWRYRVQIRLPDGSTKRIEGTPNINTKEAALRAEKEHIFREEEAIRNPRVPCETFEKFAPEFLKTCGAINKPSEVATKEMILRCHLVPAFGSLRLDAIRYAEIQDYASGKVDEGLSKKTVNNHLTVLRRLLVVAKKRKMIETVPEIEWLKVPPQDFDYLDFGEAQRLIDAADEEWRPMITVAIKTGLRLGELIALRWREDVDLVKGQIRVRQSATRGVVTTPKSGKPREVDLGDEAIAALKAARHIRGPLVFCDEGGRMLGKNEVKWPLWRACRKAGLRQIGWHALRHTFASHLVMRGASVKAVQELLGHATLDMTMRYSHLSPATRREAVKLLDGPFRGDRAATERAV